MEFSTVLFVAVGVMFLILVVQLIRLHKLKCIKSKLEAEKAVLLEKQDG